MSYFLPFFFPFMLVGASHHRSASPSSLRDLFDIHIVSCCLSILFSLFFPSVVLAASRLEANIPSLDIAEWVYQIENQQCMFHLFVFFLLVPRSSRVILYYA